MLLPSLLAFIILILPMTFACLAMKANPNLGIILIFCPPTFQCISELKTFSPMNINECRMYFVKYAAFYPPTTCSDGIIEAGNTIKCPGDQCVFILGTIRAVLDNEMIAKFICSGA